MESDSWLKEVKAKRREIRYRIENRNRNRNGNRE
jgi:hypothetical protein